MYVAHNIHAVIRLGKTIMVFKYRVVNYRDTHTHTQTFITSCFRQVTKHELSSCVRVYYGLKSCSESHRAGPSPHS